MASVVGLGLWLTFSRLLGPERAGGKLCPPLGLCRGATLVPSATVAGSALGVATLTPDFPVGIFFASVSKRGVGSESREGTGTFCKEK